MYALPMMMGGNPNAVIVQANGTEFDTTMPARLSGLIDPAEFAASMARCNTVYAPTWGRYASRLLMVSGFIAWVIVIATRIGSSDFNPTLIFGTFAAVAVCFIVGGIWSRAEQQSRNTALAQQVQSEHAYYNGQERAAVRGPLPVPMSWSLATTQVVSGYVNRRVWNTYQQICIELGGGFAPVAMMQPYLAQPQPQQYQPQPQQYQQSGYQSQAQVAPQQSEGMRAPLLATEEGANYSSSGNIATCNQCGRVAANASDKFCASCGGTYSR